MATYEVGFTDTSETEFEFDTEEFTNLNSLDADANGEIQQINGFSVFDSSNVLDETDTFQFFINKNFANSYLHLFLHDMTGDADLRLYLDENDDGLVDPDVDTLLASSLAFGPDPESIAFYLPGNIGTQEFVPLIAEVRYFSVPSGARTVISYDLDIAAVSTGPEQSADPIALADDATLFLTGTVPRIDPGFEGFFIQDEAATTYWVEIESAGTLMLDVSSALTTPILRAYEDSNSNDIFDSDDLLLAESASGSLEVDVAPGFAFLQVARPASEPSALDYDLTLSIGSGFDGRLDGAIDFNPLQYLASYRDLISAFGLDPAAAIAHYEQFGLIEERASDLFDEVRYVASHGDLITAFGTDFEAATEHYISFGAAEGRSTDLFDPVSYLNQNPDLQAVFGNNLFEAALHYIRFGFAEGRDIGLGTGYEGRLDGVIGFNPAQYLASYDDLIAALGFDQAAATAHYQQFGLIEERSSDLFDEVSYLASHGDLIEVFGADFEAATEHYIRFGASEGRSTQIFDPVDYLNNYADLQAAFGNDLSAAALHYIQNGYAEGRTY